MFKLQYTVKRLVSLGSSDSFIENPSPRNSGLSTPLSPTVRPEYAAGSHEHDVPISAVFERVDTFGIRTGGRVGRTVLRGVGRFRDECKNATICDSESGNVAVFRLNVSTETAGYYCLSTNRNGSRRTGVCVCVGGIVSIRCFIHRRTEKTIYKRGRARKTAKSLSRPVIFDIRAEVIVPRTFIGLDYCFPRRPEPCRLGIHLRSSSGY